MGCAATAIIGAFASINTNYFKAAIHAMATFSIAGQKAEKYAKGPGTFYIHLLDMLFQLNENNINTFKY